MKYLHSRIGEGNNVRHSLAMTIHHFGERILTWAKVVVEREIEGDEDPREDDED